jgi:uncharacterized protein
VASRPSFYQVLLRATLVLHLPLGLTLWHAASRAVPVWQAALFGAFGVALGMAPAPGRIRAALDDVPRSWFATQVVDQLYYVHWCACVFLLVPGLLIWLAAWLLLAPVHAHQAGVAVYALGLVISAWGVLVRRRWLRVERHEVRIAGLPKGFDGYRVAHVSDLHIGSLSSEALLRANARAIEEAEVDLVVATGDYVTNGTAFHDAIADLLGGLKSKDGVYASMGNHDYFGDGEPLLSKLAARGVNVLRNRGATLTRAGDRLHLAGVDDTWTRRADMEKALADAPDGVVTVLLAHDPTLFLDAAKRGVALTLSGHTHGGQVAVPFIAKFASLSHLAHPFHQGMYRIASSTLYVHPGLGTTGAPVRLGVAPTVAIHTLRAG